MVDAGSSGAETFLLEKEEVIDRAKVRVLAFLNIVANGMQGGLEQTVDQMDVKRCAETIKKYPDIIVGVKTAHYWTEEPWDAEHTPWAAVDKAEECGRAANVPVMFDFWPRPDRSYAELILKKMRPGDIHTHVFAQQFPILLPDGKLNPILAEARARGVIFDVGHGAGSFWFRNAVPAVKQGFIPDSMSTDLHTGNFTVLSMTQVMSKFLAMGVPLQDIVRRSTVNPAQEIHRPELGTLSVGKEADIAVLEQLNGSFSYIDCGFARMDGKGQTGGTHDGAGGTDCLRSLGPQHGRVGESPSAIFQYAGAGAIPGQRWRMTFPGNVFSMFSALENRMSGAVNLGNRSRRIKCQEPSAVESCCGPEDKRLLPVAPPSVPAQPCRQLRSVAVPR